MSQTSCFSDFNPLALAASTVAPKDIACWASEVIVVLVVVNVVVLVAAELLCNVAFGCFHQGFFAAPVQVVG